VDLSTEDRFRPIEATLQTVAERVLQTEGIVITIAESSARTQGMISDVMRTLDRYMESSNARMTRIEENLDALIRAIPAEHTNAH